MSFWPASSQIVVCFVLFILPGPSLIMGIAEAEAELRIMRAKVALFFFGIFFALLRLFFIFLSTACTPAGQI